MRNRGSPHPAAAPATDTGAALCPDRAEGPQPVPIILLVDDNADAREMYVLSLQFEGFACMTARDGREALERIRERRPALILMDAAMPVMDGWEATRRIKADPATRDIPLLILTAHAFAEHRLHALAAGANGFLAKPILPDELILEIRRVLRPTDSPGRLAPGSM